MELIFLAILWIVYFVIHSVLIAIPVTNYFRKLLGKKYKYYRILYNSVSIVFIFPILYYSLSIKQKPFFIWDGYLVVVKYSLIVFSFLLLYLGAKKYSMLQFIGVSQIKNQNSQGLINHSGKLDASGILGLIRHPFYAAVFPLVWVRSLDDTSLITNIVFSIYTIVGTLLEERKLIQEFGDEYSKYQKEVSMYFPFKWIIKRIKANT